jgi:hypothetical protein
MKKLMIALAALAISGTAVAGPSWTYVDLGAVIGDSSTKDQETQGVALRGSFGFGNIWHAQLELGQGETNGGKSSNPSSGSDNFIYTIRGGIHPAITDNTDFVLDLGYTDIEDEFNFGQNFATTKENIKIIDIKTGVRSNVGPLELRAFVSLGMVDGERSDEEGRDVNYMVGGQYNFSDAWSVGADVNLAERGDLMDLYVRWSF